MSQKSSHCHLTVQEIKVNSWASEHIYIGDELWYLRKLHTFPKIKGFGGEKNLKANPNRVVPIFQGIYKKEQVRGLYNSKLFKMAASSIWQIV